MPPFSRMHERDGNYPRFQTHFWPRSANGRRALLLFVALFALVEPPLLEAVANRIEPWVFGLPFLYAYLLAVYGALITVLLWAHRKGL